MLVVFDVDGVILDSNAFWAHMASSLLTSLFIQPEDHLDEKINSFSIEEGIKYLNKQYDLSLTNLDIQNYIYDYYRSKVMPKQDILSLIYELDQHKIEMNILTSNDQLIIDTILDRFGLKQYFTHIYTNQNKHDPSTFKQFKQEEICLIDDSIYALKTAKEASWKVLGIYDPDSFENKEEIEKETNITREELFL